MLHEMEGVAPGHRDLAAVHVNQMLNRNPSKTGNVTASWPSRDILEACETMRVAFVEPEPSTSSQAKRVSRLRRAIATRKLTGLGLPHK